jgi:hypothetical protein
MRRIQPQRVGSIVTANDGVGIEQYQSFAQCRLGLKRAYESDPVMFDCVAHPAVDQKPVDRMLPSQMQRFYLNRFLLAETRKFDKKWRDSQSGD